MNIPELGELIPQTVENKLAPEVQDEPGLKFRVS